jgi:hypothetical protein
MATAIIVSVALSMVISCLQTIEPNWRTIGPSGRLRSGTHQQRKKAGQNSLASRL